MAAQAVGSIVQGIGGYKAGKVNARALKAQAREELVAGNLQEQRVRDAARVQIGEQIGAQFSNGLMGGSGSALDALRESQINMALDALEIRRQAQAKAAALRAEAKSAKREGVFGLVSGVLGAGARYARERIDWADARRGRTPSSGGSRGRPGEGIY